MGHAILSTWSRAAVWAPFLILPLLPPAPAQVPDLVFVSRRLSAEPEAERRPRAIESALIGRLVVREATGRIRALVDALARPEAGVPLDVMDPDVSYDARSIVFAGYSAEEKGWRIFEIGADGTGLRQVTRSDRRVDLSLYGAAGPILEGYDDLDPCYLPDGRICLVSTRYPGIAPDGRVRATNLYVVNADGTGLHRITTERFGADTPAVEPSTGMIVYSRWWRTPQIRISPQAPPPKPIPPGSPEYPPAPPPPPVNEAAPEPTPIAEEEFPGVNSWFLARIAPDGTGLSMFSGFRLDRDLTQAYRPSFLPSGEALAIFLPKTPFIGFPRGYGLRRVEPGPSVPAPLGGPQSFGSQFGVEPIGAPPYLFFYASATGLPGGLLLATATPAQVFDYGIYLKPNSLDPPVLLYNEPGTAELDALPLVARPVPPVIPETARDVMAEDAPQTVEEALAQGGSFVFQVDNIHFNAPVDEAMPSAPPIGRRLAIEFYMGPQRTSTGSADRPLLIARQEIPPDGRVRAELPAGVPLFEVLRLPDGRIPVGRDGQIFHVGGLNFGRRAVTSRCVGCHAGHSQMAVPQDASWTNVAPSATVLASSRRPLRTAPRGSFHEINLIDRRTGTPQTEWAAGVEDVSRVELSWNLMIRAREVVLHGTSPGRGKFGTRDQTIHRVTLTTRADGRLQESFTVEREILPGGTRVALDSSLEITTLDLEIRAADATGSYEGQKPVALAEVEVLGRAVSGPRASFIRGDADCNASVDITDVIVILLSRFDSGPSLCCEGAADVNDDGRLDISDPIALIRFLFLAQSQPAAPFPACGQGRNGGSCEKSACP